MNLPSLRPQTYHYTCAHPTGYCATSGAVRARSLRQAVTLIKATVWRPTWGVGGDRGPNLFYDAPLRARVIEESEYVIWRPELGETREQPLATVAPAAPSTIEWTPAPPRPVTAQDPLREWEMA